MTDIYFYPFFSRKPPVILLLILSIHLKTTHLGFDGVQKELLSDIDHLLYASQVRSMNSSSSSTCANESTCWDRVAQADSCSVVNLPVPTPENLYLMGKDKDAPSPK